MATSHRALVSRSSTSWERLPTDVTQSKSESSSRSGSPDEEQLARQIDDRIRNHFERYNLTVDYEREPINMGAEATIHYGSVSVNQKTVKCAVRVIDRRKLGREYTQIHLPRELYLLPRLQHPNLLHIYHIYPFPKPVTPFPKELTEIFVFMELAEGGDLHSWMDTFGIVPEAQAKVWFSQLVSAVDYLHSELVAHRDIKLENCLLTHYGQLKLIDFGYAAPLYDPKAKKRVPLTEDIYAGSEHYMSPESVVRPYDPLPGDIWALGVLLYVMLTGKFPYKVDIECFVRRGAPFEVSGSSLEFERKGPKLSRAAKKLIGQMIRRNPEKRLTSKEIMSNGWLTL